MTPHSPPWSGRSAPPLHLIIEPSRSLRLAIFAVHGLAGCAALANPLPLWAKAALLAAVTASLYRTYREYVADPAFTGLTHIADGQWEAVGRAGATTATLAGSTLVTPWIVILHLDAEAGRLAIPICRDATDPEAFRRLRVRLRTAGLRAEEAS